MSRIDALIKQYAPEGVTYRPLRGVGKWYGGGTPSKQHREYWDGGDVPWISPKDMGDAILAGTEDRITRAAVAASATRVIAPGAVAIVVRSSILDHTLPIAIVPFEASLNQDMKAVEVADDVLPSFIAHSLRSHASAILRTVRKTGGSVASLDVPKLMAYRIPVPTLEVQREIVSILDAFTELEAELEARRQQYAHYRDLLLSFTGERVRWAPLSEIGSIYGGLTGKSKADFADGNAPFITYMNVFRNLTTDIAPNTLVKVGPNERQTVVAFGDVLFTASSESRAEVGMASAVTVEPTKPTYLNSFCFGFRPNSIDELHPEFAKHLFRARVMRDQIVKTANGVTRINISKGPFGKMTVPLPDIDLQKRIAEVLDNFEALTNDLSSGLPAEIEARRQQYAYYRDRLLTFEEAVA